VKHKQGPFAIDCRAPHYAEIAAVVNLDGHFDHAPSSDEVDAVVACGDLAERYLGRPIEKGFDASATVWTKAAGTRATATPSVCWSSTSTES